MTRRLSFMNLKVRTNLILVLVLFVLMLVFGAGVGLYSIRASNQTLQKVAHLQNSHATLYDAIDAFKSVQVEMGLAVELILQKKYDDLARLYVDPDAGMFGRMGTIEDHLDAGRAAFADSQRDYARFQQLTQHEEDRIYITVGNAYASLMNGGVEPLFDFLQQGDVDGYNAFKDSTGAYLQQDLYDAVRQFNQYQEAHVADISATEQQHYYRVMIMVAIGMACSLVLSLLVYVFLDRVVLRPLRQAGSHFDRIAAGDLTQRVDAHANNEIGALYTALARMQDSLTRTVSTVRQGVNEIQLGANEIYSGNTDLSSRTEQQAAALQQTAASMEELAGTVQQNTDNAIEADRLAVQASQVVHRGGQSVQQVVKVMEDISSSSGKVADIVNVIDGIAFQTNILALNAAVEAARAGEQGKGFAVVAGEVRTLAQRSAQAAREIKTLIEGSLTTISSGAQQASQTGDIMRELVASVDGVTTLMREIASASREQADGVSQVNQAVSQMDGAVQQNAALVEQAAAAAGSLQAQSDRLSEAVAVFKLNAHDVIDMEASRAGLLGEEDEDRGWQGPAQLQAT